MVFLLFRERLQAASRCSSVILATSVTSVPTQPQGVEEAEAPRITGRFSRSPGRSPLGGRDAFLLRLGGMSSQEQWSKADSSSQFGPCWPGPGCLLYNQPTHTTLAFHMDGADNLIPRWRRILLRVKGIIFSSGDVNEKRIRRRKKLVDIITRRLTFVKWAASARSWHLIVIILRHLARIALFISGYLWFLLIPLPHLGRGTYIDENALQPGQVCLIQYFGIPVITFSTPRSTRIGTGAMCMLLILTWRN